jgi:hypothetical protein
MEGQFASAPVGPPHLATEPSSAAEHRALEDAVRGWWARQPSEERAKVAGLSFAARVEAAHSLHQQRVDAHEQLPSYTNHINATQGRIAGPRVIEGEAPLRAALAELARNSVALRTGDDCIASMRATLTELQTFSDSLDAIQASITVDRAHARELDDPTTVPRVAGAYPDVQDHGVMLFSQADAVGRELLAQFGTDVVLPCLPYTPGECRVLQGRRQLQAIVQLVVPSPLHPAERATHDRAGAALRGELARLLRADDRSNTSGCFRARPSP